MNSSQPRRSGPRSAARAILIAVLVGAGAFAASPLSAGGSVRYYQPRDGSPKEQCLAEASYFYVPNEGNPAIDFARDAHLKECLARFADTSVGHSAARRARKPSPQVKSPTMMTAGFAIELTDGTVLPAIWSRPADALASLVLALGASASMRHRSMTATRSTSTRARRSRPVRMEENSSQGYRGPPTSRRRMEQRSVGAGYR